MSPNDRLETGAAIATSETETTTDSLAKKTTRPHGPGRIWRWFWRSDDLRRASLATTAARLDGLRRARLPLEVARRTLESSEPFDGRIDPIVCDLYRQSIYWSLQALNSSAAVQVVVHSSAAASSNPWHVVDSEVMRSAAGDIASLAKVEAAVDGQTFWEFMLLPAEESAALARALRGVAVALISELEVPERAVEAIWLQRLLRIGLVLVFLAIVAGVALRVRDSAERARDIAQGKPWRTSSWYGGCVSPEQECTEPAEFFFHTQEEASPWVEFDLGSRQRFSAVRVENRKDCCMERAAPLIVEVSNDQIRWKTVARREAVFSSWLAEFAPTEARWVRLRAERTVSLHLMRVMILR